MISAAPVTYVGQVFNSGNITVSSTETAFVGCTFSASVGLFIDATSLSAAASSVNVTVAGCTFSDGAYIHISGTANGSFLTSVQACSFVESSYVSVQSLTLDGSAALLRRQQHDT